MPELRLATLADLAELLLWRNDPVTRHYRPDPRMITECEHAQWFARRQDSDNKIYVFIESGKARGNITLDVDHASRSCELGWIVAPELRGNGIACRMVALALAEVVPAGYVPWAKVRHDNTASHSVALACGFRTRPAEMVYYDLRP